MQYIWLEMLGVLYSFHVFQDAKKMMGINYFQLIYYGIRCFKHGNKEGDKEFVMSIAMEW